uniref:Uncharacterized protein n=1 Tax=Thermocrinis ruber TaxID=75906 RepID=A0A7C5T095_9AQUI
MKDEKFESLVPEFFYALGKFYEKKPVAFWRDLYYVVRYLLDILAFSGQLEEFEDFEYGLDDLVSPLLEEFIKADNPKALRELMVELSHVRSYLKQELELRSSPRP